MKTYLTILGCGSSLGVPRADGTWGKCNSKNIKNYRTRCSALISRGKSNILIDTSPDLRQQLLNNRIKTINSVLYTHEHGDQTHGINDLRIFFIKSKNRINIYGNKKTMDYLKNNFTYCFKGYFGYPAILKKNLVKKHFYIGKDKEKIEFKSFEVKHGLINSVAYIFNQTAYISDCSYLSKSNIKNLKNIKNLIIDCLRFKPHYSHLVYTDVIKIINKLNPKKTILTNLNSDIDYNYLLKILPKNINIKPAFDGMKLSI